MTLTKDDLAAIATMVGEVVETTFDRKFDEKFDAKFDEKFDEKFDAAFDRKFDEKFSPAFDLHFDAKIEPVMQQIAAGFLNVDVQLAELREIVGRIERAQLDQAEQLDRHELAIGHIRKTLRSV